MIYYNLQRDNVDCVQIYSKIQSIYLVKGSVFVIKILQSERLSTNLEVLKTSKHFQCDSEPWQPKSMTISNFVSAFMKTLCHSYEN